MQDSESLDINSCVWYHGAILLCIGIFLYLIIYPKHMKCGLFIVVLWFIATFFLYRGCIQYRKEGFTYDREYYKRILEYLKNDHDVKDLKDNHIRRKQAFYRVYDDIVEILYQTDAVNRIDTKRDNWIRNTPWDSSISNMITMIYKIRNEKNDREAYGLLLNAGAQNNDVKHFRDDVTALLKGTGGKERERLAERVIDLIEVMAAKAFILMEFSQNNKNRLKDLGKPCNGIVKPITCPMCNEQPFCTSTGWACPTMWTEEAPVPAINDRCLGLP